MPSRLPQRSTTARIARRISAGLIALEATAIAVIFGFMVYAVLTQVMTRYLLNEPSPWTEESARYSFIWLSMLGAALGVQRRSHFGFDFVMRSLPAPVARLAGGLGACVILATVGVLVWQGCKLMQMEAFATGPATNVPMAWIYAAVPVGSALIIAHIVLEFVGAGLRFPSPQTATAAAGEPDNHATDRPLQGQAIGNVT